MFAGGTRTRRSHGPGDALTEVELPSGVPGQPRMRRSSSSASRQGEADAPVAVAGVDAPHRLARLVYKENGDAAHRAMLVSRGLRKGGWLRTAGSGARRRRP
jgi:hypothetical protein